MSSRTSSMWLHTWKKMPIFSVNAKQLILLFLSTLVLSFQSPRCWHSGVWLSTPVSTNLLQWSVSVCCENQHATIDWSRQDLSDRVKSSLWTKLWHYWREPSYYLQSEYQAPFERRRQRPAKKMTPGWDSPDFREDLVNFSWGQSTSSAFLLNLFLTNPFKKEIMRLCNSIKLTALLK